MRTDAIDVEETRLEGVTKITEYPSFHERHRVFPEIFENRNHHKILDVAAGVGCAAQRIRDIYTPEAAVVVNDISPTAVSILMNMGFMTTSFDIDNKDKNFPFQDGSFDAVIALSTIEHVIHVDHFVEEIYRILAGDGCFYLSAPNYTALYYMPEFLIRGKTFHNPLKKGSDYEFYAHVRYFTYNTMIEYIGSFGFVPDTVYMPLPGGSAHYQKMYTSSRAKALAFRYSMWFLYKFFSPRWASEPVICFTKHRKNHGTRIRKVVL